MSRKPNLFNPMEWWALGVSQQMLMLGAAETIWRRGLMMANGAMSPGETATMYFEKPAAFAKGFERAARAAARGKSAVAVTDAFIKPVSARASANARRLRR